ncbi:MAG TPA: hypothetical protein VK143_09860 [Burkholderiales bacterium]|nr:hypothetical protein [Burkholderiales bacterium]
MPKDLLSDRRMHLRAREQRRGRVAQRVEDDALLRQRPDPERAAVVRAAAVPAVVGPLDVATARLAAAMLVALDDAGAAESAAQDGLEIRVRRALRPVCGREDPLRRRQLDRGVDVRSQRFRNRHGSVVATLGDVGLARPADRDRPLAQVDIFLLESKQLAAPQTEEEGRGEQRPPLRRQRSEHARDVFRGDGPALALGFFELRQLEPVDRVRRHPPANRAHRRDRVEPMAVRPQVVQRRGRQLADLRVE